MKMFLLTAIILVLPLIRSIEINSYESLRTEIFQRLEKQIVENAANLFRLRQVLFPTSQAQPTLVNVSYHLKVTSLNNHSCPGDPESADNPRYDHLSNEYLEYLGVNAWSSNIFYTLFHPATINRLQPQALQTILVGIEGICTENPALIWTTTGPMLTVAVVIDVELPCWPTFVALKSSLNDLTSVLKIYADFQRNVSSWGGDDRAYALLGNVFVDKWWLYIGEEYPTSCKLPIINVILSVITTLVISCSFHYALWHVVPAKSGEKNFLFSHTIIWSGVAILAHVNFFLLLYEVSSLSNWCAHESSCLESAGESKIGWLVWMTVCMIIAFIILLVRFIEGKTKHRDILIPEWRAFILGTPFLNTFILLTVLIYDLLIKPLLTICSIQDLWTNLVEKLHLCGVGCPQSVKSSAGRFIEFTATYVLYMTVFLSASLLSFSIVPVLLQAFLFPFRIIAAYSFFFAAFSIYFLATFMATFFWKEKPPTTGRLLLYLSGTTIVSVYISIISVPSVSLYQLLDSGSLSHSPLVLFAASVLPSLSLFSPLVWLFRSKFLPRFMDIDTIEKENFNEECKNRKVEKAKMVEAKDLKSFPEHVTIEINTTI